MVLFYSSANRGERVFDEPDQFNVARPMQPTQVGFGAGGPFLPRCEPRRRELVVAFEELHQRLPLIRSTAEPDYLQSNFINGIKRLPAWN